MTVYLFQVLDYPLPFLSAYETKVHKTKKESFFYLHAATVSILELISQFLKKVIKKNKFNKELSLGISTLKMTSSGLKEKQIESSFVQL